LYFRDYLIDFTKEYKALKQALAENHKHHKNHQTAKRQVMYIR